MAQSDQQRWDRKWAEASTDRAPANLLISNRRHLSSGIAVDLACGLGQNSHWLAANGYNTVGFDISLVALMQARTTAIRERVATRSLFVQYDLDIWTVRPESVDLIAVFRFLDRRLFPIIRQALRPGGLIFYETRHTGILSSQPETNRDYLLEPGELRERFADWHILYHLPGKENSSLVARRPR